MKVRQSERGTALLTVLLLVAVIATISATALDRIGIATRLAVNVSGVAQGRAWLATAELLALTRIEDLLGSDRAQTTLAGNWMGVERSIALPTGGMARVTVRDGANCFNLNSLAEKRLDGTSVARPQAVRQFAALMTLLGIDPGKADRIANSAADHIDSDSTPLPGGAEDGGATAFPANQMMADASELRSVRNVDGRDYQLLRRWICALPTADLSPLNVNTLLPEQAPLLAMLGPGVIDLNRARAQIAARPASGYRSVLDFWDTAPFAGLSLPQEATRQVQVKSRYFALEAAVDVNQVTVEETALIDASAVPARIVRRQWGEAG